MLSQTGVYRYRTIAVGTEAYEPDDFSVTTGAQLAELVGATRLHLVTAVHVPYLQITSATEAVGGLLPSDFIDSMTEDAKARLERVVVPATSAEITREVRQGSPAYELARAGQDVDADLLIVTSRGLKGLRRFMMGSVSSALVRASHCPVLVLRETGVPVQRTQRILAAIDLSSVSDRVLKNALALAAPAGGEVHVLSLYETPLIANTVFAGGSPMKVDAKAAYTDAVKPLVSSIDDGSADIDIDVVGKSPPWRAILDVAELTKPDLIVMGTSGHGAWHRAVLGSNANRVLTDSPCPIVVVPYDARPLHEAPWASVPSVTASRDDRSSS